LNDLENNLEKLDTNKGLILFCQSGKRSKQAVSILKQLKINNCFSIKETSSEIKKHLENINYER